MSSICADGAFEAVASVCDVVFGPEDRRQTVERFTSSWLTGFLVGYAAQEPCLWSGGPCIMEQSISIVHTHTDTHKLSLFP